MTDPRAAARPRWEGWRWLWQLVASRPSLLIRPLLSGGAAALLTLPSLWLMRFALDQADPKGNIGLLLTAGAGILLSRALSSLVVVAMCRTTLARSKQVVATVRIALHERLLHLRWSDYGRIDSAQLQARLVQDTERVEQFLSGIVCVALPALIPLVCYFALLFWVAWPLALVVLVAALLSRALSWFAAMFQRRAIIGYQDRFEQFHVGTQRSLRMLPVTRVQGTEAHDAAAYRGTVEALARSGERLTFAATVSQQAGALAGSLVIVAVLIVGGIAVIEGTVTIGTLAVFAVVANLVSGAMGSLGTSIPLALAADQALQRLLHLRGQGLDDSDGTRAPPIAPALIAFDTVCFSHAERCIIDRQSLQIRRGAVVAIAAPNGSGKTTFLELAAGLLAPDQGRVLLDGLDLAMLDRTAWRRSIGYVPQHPVFFRGTLLDNIRHGRGDVDAAALERAVHASALDAILPRLPAGFETPMGDEGKLLSGGELQRIAIARALVHAPTLLILDEPTNHLDAATVALLAERLFANESLTVLMATHDSRLLAFADQVYDLADGVLALRGATTFREVAL